MDVVIDQLIEQLNKDITKNNFLQLIERLQENEIYKDKLNYYRELYIIKFLPDVLFWQSWTTDCMVSNNMNHDQILALFDIALNDCPHINICIDLLEYCNKLVDSDLMVRYYIIYFFISFLLILLYILNILG
jgi:hypothetical protein